MMTGIRTMINAEWVNLSILVLGTLWVFGFIQFGKTERDNDNTSR